MKDLHNNVKVRRAISPQDVTGNTAAVSQIIDRQGFESVEYLIATGSLADSDATFAVTMDEGNDSGLSDASAVAAGDLLGTYAGASFTFSDDNSVFKIGYRGGKRYTRLTITPTGNSTDAYLCAVAVLGHPAQAPVT